MSGNAYIQCRFCAWKTAEWKTRKDGKKSGPTQAFGRLKEHIFEDHPAEFERIYESVEDA